MESFSNVAGVPLPGSELLAPPAFGILAADRSHQWRRNKNDSGAGLKSVFPSPPRSDRTPAAVSLKQTFPLKQSARLAPSGTARQQPESQLGSQEEQDLLK